MVFVKFHNMKQEKNFFLMSPLNSNKFFFFFTNFHFTTSQNNIAITVLKCSVFFSFFFQSMYCLYFEKNVRSFLSFSCFFIFFNMLCSTVFKFPFFSSLSFSHCPAPFCFCFFFPFFSFFFIINCSFTVHFFLNLISTSLCLYLNTITIGSLPRLFNFNPYFH